MSKLLIDNLVAFYNLQIKNNPNRKLILVYIWNTLSLYQKIIFKNIIYLDKLKIIILDSDLDKKIKLLVKIKDRLNHNLLFNIIFKEICDKKIKYLMYKEKFLQKPIEEQNKIKDNIRNNMREKYKRIKPEEKKIYHKKKRDYYINKHGIDKYKQKIRTQYNKWYKNLSIEKLQKIKLERKMRYDKISSEKKRKYKDQKKEKYNNLSNDDKKKLLLHYRENRKKKINSMNESDRINYINSIRRKKVKYFRDLPDPIKTYYYRLKTLMRQFKNNKLLYNDLVDKKKELHCKYRVN